MTYTCGIFIIDTEDKLLICHITNQPMEGRTWSIPKGLPDEGEAWVAAACRETFEETGIQIDPSNVLPLGLSPYYSKSMSRNKTLVPFLGWLGKPGHETVCVCSSMFTNQRNEEQPEVDQFRWVTFEEAESMIHESQMAKLKDAKELYFNHKGGENIQIPVGLTEEGMAEWLKNYPIPIEDFGKDWVSQFHNLLGYKTDRDSVVNLRQVLNTTRQILLNCTQGTFDVLKASHPYPKWTMVSENGKNIIIVEDDNGEQYEDYHKWVDTAYEIDTDKTGDTLEKEWKQFIVDLMAANNITVNPSWVGTIMMERPPKYMRKAHSKLLKENGFKSWLEKTYNARKVNYQTVHPTQI